MSQCVPIKRDNKRSVAEMLSACGDHLKKNNSLFFFPEGTRILDKKINLFKPGAFALALKYQVEIVPVVIHCIKKKIIEKIRHSRGRETISVKVLDPIPIDENETAKQLAKKSHSKIIEAIENWQ